MKRITQVFLGFARRPEDSSDVAFKKLLILIVALSCSACGLAWSAIYFAVFGFGLTMILPFAFVVIVGTTVAPHLTVEPSIIQVCPRNFANSAGC